jgi:transposase
MTSIAKFAAWVGIDWADAEHAVCMLPAEGGPTESQVVPQEAQAIHDWAMQLHERFGGRPVAVCLEQSRGALIYALMKYRFLTLFPVNPKQLARYREALAPSGAKDDPSDAQWLAQLVREHHLQLRAWQPADPQTRTLQRLVEDRRRWVGRRTAASNQLLQRLKESYPLALELEGRQLHAVGLLELLAKYPSLSELKRISPRQLQRWFPHGRNGKEGLELLAWIRGTQPLVTDEAVLSTGRSFIVHAVAELQHLNQVIADYDREIARVVAEHPDRKLIASFPGAGRALAPRLLAALGTDRTRYSSAQELQEYSGIAPVVTRSGKSSKVRRRRACPMFLRQTFHEFARCSMLCSEWARAYYQMLRHRGAHHHAAIRALAFKWIRILFRCWKDRTCYNEAAYLQQLRQKHAPLLQFLTTKPAQETP